jgi:hypothetical protein
MLAPRRDPGAPTRWGERCDLCSCASSIPGEAIHVIGLRVKQAGQKMGYARTFVLGLANGHMAYVTDREEYEAGGYEATASFFGPDAGDKVVDACTARMLAVK